MVKTAAGLLLLMSLTLSAQGGEGPAVSLEPKVASYDYDAIPKDPLASAFFSATFPGTGQLYNKEYLRGILTAAGFYGGLFTFQYMLYRWEILNLDTFYIEEAYNPSVVHQVTAPKPEDRQVGLPTAEKVALGAGAALMAGCYLWGIYDAYQGAKRYNRRLVAASRVRRVELALVPSPVRVRALASVRF
jgi:TM2 domain-containing membrane protein YozV